MPCDQIRYQILELKVANWGLLKKALDAMGAEIRDIAQDGIGFIHDGVGARIDLKAGSLIVESSRSESLAEQVKQAYNKQVIQAAARFGWLLRQVSDSKFTIGR